MRVIDKAAWPRREAYELHAGCAWPFYSLSFEVEVTALRALAKAEGLSFYLATVWCVTQAMNAVENFRYAERGGEIVLLDARYPSWTEMGEGAGQYRIITLRETLPLRAFCRRAKEKSAAQRGMLEPSEEGADLIYLSCVPWLRLKSATHERTPDPADSIPRITWGQWEEREGRTFLTLCLEVNHRFVDGWHVAQFAAALERLMKEEREEA